LPPLVHADTTLSSDSGVTPLAPYQGSLLPALDGPKSGRTLPQPIPSAGIGLTTPSAINQHASPATPGAASLLAAQRAGPWPALLRAGELARDADLQESGREEE
jgi:hypothetical protein